MKKVKIQDLKPGTVRGVQVYIPGEADVYKETYWNWTPSPMVAKTKKAEIGLGVLRTWHHVPVFSLLETHVDCEMFIFLSGTALMMFIDVKDNIPQMDSAEVVRIQPGTQIIVEPGKGHFVAVAEGSEPVMAVVVSPKMETPRIALPEDIEGI